MILNSKHEVTEMGALGMHIRNYLGMCLILNRFLIFYYNVDNTVAFVLEECI